MTSLLSALQQNTDSVPDNVIKQIVSDIEDGAFTQLITTQVSEVDDPRSHAQVIGQALAKQNKGTQIRRLFEDLRMIQQRVEALHQEADVVPEVPNLPDLQEHLRALVDGAEDAEQLLGQLKEVVQKYETGDSVANEIKLSIGLERSRLAYLSKNMKPPAQQFFQESMDAVLADPTYVSFQDFLKCVECVYAYFSASN